MKTPKGKLNLVINSAKAISLMLQETSVSGDPDGADMFSLLKSTLSFNYNLTII